MSAKSIGKRLVAEWRDCVVAYIACDASLIRARAATVYGALMTNPLEHRRGQRVAAAMWVRLSSSGAELGMGSIANASISGAFLETALQLPVNANITLEAISSAGVAHEGLRLSARVVRVEGRGLGIEWHVMVSPEILALLTAPPPAAEDPTTPGSSAPGAIHAHMYDSGRNS